MPYMNHLIGLLETRKLRCIFLVNYIHYSQLISHHIEADEGPHSSALFRYADNEGQTYSCAVCVANDFDFTAREV